MPANSEKKQTNRFQKGQSGNPKGKPKGTRNRATLAVEALLDGQAEDLTQIAIDKALAGDMTALRLCLDRICPPRKDRPVSVELPKIEEAADSVSALSAILAAVVAGDITPGEGQTLATLIETHRRTLETADIECRLSALEKERRR